MKSKENEANQTIQKVGDKSSQEKKEAKIKVAAKANSETSIHN